MNQTLKARRIAALAADGFEKVELVVPKKALQAAGAKVDVISLRHGNIRGVNLHEPASRVHVDKTIARSEPQRLRRAAASGGLYQSRPAPPVGGGAGIRARVRPGGEADRDPVSWTVGTRVGGTVAGQNLNVMAGRS